jgi:hypothetical protein
MTTRRAAMIPAFKPGPALVHFACVPIGEDLYYVGFSNCTRYRQRWLSVQDTTEQCGLCSPRTEQQREPIDRKKEAQSVVSERSDGAGLPGHGCNGTGTPALCAPLQPDHRQNVELKLLPAPQIAGLLPARVPVPTNGQHKYVRVPGVGIGYLTTVTDREYHQITLIGLSQAACVWKQAHQFMACEQPGGVTPYQASVKLGSEQVKVRMKG